MRQQNFVQILQRWRLNVMLATVPGLPRRGIVRLKCFAMVELRIWTGFGSCC